MQLLRSTCRPVPTLCGRWKPTSSGQEPHQSAVALRPVTHPSEQEQSLLLFLLLQFATLADFSPETCLRIQSDKE